MAASMKTKLSVMIAALLMIAAERAAGFEMTAVVQLEKLTKK